MWVPDDDYPIILKRQSEGMYLLQRVRDESTASPSPTTASSGARRPAQRARRDSGIGKATKRLLNHFGSVKAMREASVEDFKKVKRHRPRQKPKRFVHRAAPVSRPSPQPGVNFRLQGPVG